MPPSPLAFLSASLTNVLSVAAEKLREVTEVPGAPHVPGWKAALGGAFLNAFGWEVEGGAPDVKKAVVIAAPHTSNWDLPFSIAVASVLGVKMSWVGKHTLFKPPFGNIMRALGGIAVDRRAHHNAVNAIATKLGEADEMLLLVPPEGTRGRAKRWKTGFYFIAQEAHTPIVLGYLDYSKKRGGLAQVFTPSGDLTKDFETIRSFYTGIEGKYKSLTGEVALHE